MLVRLTRLGFACDAAPLELRSAREHFEQHDYLRLPGFIEPGLLRVIQRYLRRAGFRAREYAEIGHDLTLLNNPLWRVLHFLMNDPQLFRLMRRVTGCPPIGCFTGRIYRMVARRGVELNWHDDKVDDVKLVAVSVNLSDAKYRGGTLQIREKSCDVSEEVPNLGLGDAIIFRVAEHLEHRVTPVEGKIPKTALSGWFRSRPRYKSLEPRDLAAFSESTISRGGRNEARRALPSPYDTAKIPGAIVSRTLPRATFVADVGTAMCYGLNQTGGRIWKLLAQGHSMRSLSAIIAREYGAPRRDVERDVLALACRLAERDLIKIVNAARRPRGPMRAAAND
jgi:coenzyme PQQ synthesis protein D (PqqD)/2-oxoglutarate-Fe(II)-dependent oxygenase superfamily protein